jgi:peptidoglycan/LPS O-acetylase OafA/YrhL
VFVTRIWGLFDRYAGGVGLWMRWVVSLALCVFIAWIYYVLVEKPFLRLSKKLLFVHPSARAKPLPEEKIAV